MSDILAPSIPPPRASPPPCALCQNVRELKKSHIVPNAYFRSMKNVEGKLVSFQLEPDARVRLTQDSWYERLLCETCEGRFSALETRWIARMRSVNQAITEGAPVVELPDFDYDSFRTFLLSILWRSSVSTLDPFESVKLSTTDNEALRLALLAGSTRAVGKWHILLRAIVDTQRVLQFEQFLLKPTGTAAGSTIRFRYIFGGFVVDFFNEKMTTPDSLVRDEATFKVFPIAMTDVDEIMYAGVWAIDKDRRGLTDARIKRTASPLSDTSHPPADA